MRTATDFDLGPLGTPQWRRWRYMEAIAALDTDRHEHEGHQKWHYFHPLFLARCFRLTNTCREDCLLFYCFTIYSYTIHMHKINTFMDMMDGYLPSHYYRTPKDRILDLPRVMERKWERKKLINTRQMKKMAKNTFFVFSQNKEIELMRNANKWDRFRIQILELLTFQNTLGNPVQSYKTRYTTIANHYTIRRTTSTTLWLMNKTDRLVLCFGSFAWRQWHLHLLLCTLDSWQTLCSFIPVSSHHYYFSLIFLCASWLVPSLLVAASSIPTTKKSPLLTCYAPPSSPRLWW